MTFPDALKLIAIFILGLMLSIAVAKCEIAYSRDDCVGCCK